MVEIGLLILDFVVDFSYEVCAVSWMVCCVKLLHEHFEGCWWIDAAETGKEC